MICNIAGHLIVNIYYRASFIIRVFGEGDRRIVDTFHRDTQEINFCLRRKYLVAIVGYYHV